ncbi:hypothetical protein EYF80_005052 [Liparis tanakae]|uniref:Uncharacterized protein n=1 Tax=Liparis tanakae TaxID=230148 RepID=A0A4Z2J3N9_9TELE|nr:hypothetical protein EYF80_005052 [Liparis tanakae]
MPLHPHNPLGGDEEAVQGPAPPFALDLKLPRRSREKKLRDLLRDLTGPASRMASPSPRGPSASLLESVSPSWVLLRTSSTDAAEPFPFKEVPLSEFPLLPPFVVPLFLKEKKPAIPEPFVVQPESSGKEGRVVPLPQTPGRNQPVDEGISELLEWTQKHDSGASAANNDLYLERCENCKEFCSRRNYVTTNLSVALLSALAAAAPLHPTLRVGALCGLLAHLLLLRLLFLLLLLLFLLLPPLHFFVAYGRPKNEGIGTWRDGVGVGALISGGRRRVRGHNGGHTELLEPLEREGQDDKGKDPAAALQADQVVAHGERPSPDHCHIHRVISGETVIHYFVTIEIKTKRRQAHMDREEQNSVPQASRDPPGRRRRSSEL